MAMSFASRPFTVKGTLWMCTVWFVAFFWRQRGWAWVLIGIKARRAVRMAAPPPFSMFCAQLCCSAANASCLFGCQCQWQCQLQLQNKSSPQARAERPRAGGERELLPSPSRLHPEACELVLCLLVSLQAASHASEFKRALRS